MADQQARGREEGEAKLPIVGIGASAGGLEALQRLFQILPDDLGAAYVVIVHLAPDRESELPAILARETSMPVIQVGDHSTADLRPDHVYVIAPGRKLELTNSSVGASKFEQPRGQRAAVDLFFRSLCNAHGEIFAVILSGGGSDGALGAKSVKDAGGLVLVQDPHEAAHESMPRAAIATGVADVVLPVRDLARRLAELVRDRHQVARLIRADQHPIPVPDDEEAALQRVLDLLRRRTAHDFTKYKRNTVLRRLGRRMQLSRTASIPEYLRYLEDHVEEVQALFHDLLITVTTFFRDADAWATLGEEVVGPLVKQADPSEPIRCWVPGCATGEEAYSLVILFAEEMERAGKRQPLTVFASDIDERALSMAREGVYPASIVADLSEERIRRWFRSTDDHYRVVTELRERVVFTTHRLQRDPPFSRLHLVSCRNLLIYLNRELQDQVMEIFRYALRDDGYLFLGSSETARAELFSPLVKQHRIYQARPARGRKPVLPDLPTGIPHPVRRHEWAPPRRDREGELDAHRVLLEERAPPSVVVDESWSVRTLSETAGRFFQPSGGSATHALVETVRPELRGELIVALRHAFEAREPHLSDFVAVRFNGTPRRVAVLVQPRLEGERPPVRALVTFLEAGPASPASEPEGTGGPSSDRERTLIEKLHQAEQHIDHLRADHHAAEEDLRAANEELQSLNEEYRSTTEELETSKEELQSINEELQTMNVQLKAKLDEISRAHDDLENLMVATDIATLFVDRGLCIQWYTPQLAEIFNVKGHDVGRPIADITHSLQYPGLTDDAQRVLQDLTPIEREVRTTGAGQFILRLRPYRTLENKSDGVVITLVDITALKQTEAVLRESEERFRALVDASSQMVWTTDPEGAVVDDSPSWRAFTGQSQSERTGWGWLRAFHPEDRAEVERGWQAAVQSQTPFDREFRVYHAASQSYRWTSVRAVPLKDDSGALRGWVGMNTDITDRRRAEEALREADRRKDVFLAMLGHELRNPLAAIRNGIMAAEASAAAAAGREAPPSRVVERVLGLVDRQSRHMTRLVDDLLDVTRIARNKLELQREPIDLGRSVGEAAATLQPEVERAEVSLALEVPDRPLMVDADPERLTQIVDNLLLNAINFTRPGGKIVLRARRDGGEALVVIRDTGIGMEPAAIPTLFEPYQQVDPHHASKGLGLGLPLVKSLVDLHGGTIAAESDGPGRGSEFRVRLPLARDPESAADAPTPAPTERHPPIRRVLVVDDQTDVADAFASLLEGLGQEVRVAYSGERALQIAMEHRPEIAFLDLAMPGMNGPELAEQLRRHFPPEALTLVALSGFSRKDNPTQRHFQHHLVKPAELTTVSELLNEVGT